MRFKLETLINGEVYSPETKYLTTEQLQRQSPRSASELLGNKDCVGVVLNTAAADMKYLITDRDKVWNQ